MQNDFVGEDIFDSRDVTERIEELEAIDSDDRVEYEDEELEELIKFRDEVNSAKWNDGITFINEDYFEDYAREFAEDIGAINRDLNWPANCIDWEQASRELKLDYTEVYFSFDNITYYYR